MISLLAALSLPLALVNAYANPGPCTGDCWAHDPGLWRRDDGTYFLFSTAGGIQISSAPALNGPWTRLDEALPGGSTINHPGNTNLWVSLVFFFFFFFFFLCEELSNQLLTLC